MRWNPYILIISGLLLFSCSPTKRLSRLLKKHPELLKTDTVTVTDTVTIQGWRVDTFIQTDTSTALIDSVIKDINEVSASTIPKEIIERIRYLYRYKKVIADTARYNFPMTDAENGIIDTILVKLWQNVDRIGISVERKNRAFIRVKKVPCPELVYKPSWWQNFLMWSGGIAWIFLVLILLWRWLLK